MNAKVSCNCGKTSIIFAAHTPRFIFECGCVDCKQKLYWAQYNNNNNNIWNNNIPDLLTLIYIDNSIIDIIGKENLCYYKLRDNALSPFLCSKCCYSVLLVDNKRYNNNVLMIIANGCKVNVNFITPIARIFLKDIEKIGKNINTLNEFIGPKENCFYNDNNRDNIEYMMKVFKSADTDTDVSEEFKSIGKPFKTILNEFNILTPINLNLIEGQFNF